MAFRDVGDGAVEGVFGCDRRWEGAEGRLHGGVVAALLDGAMYTCLTASRIEAVTADLQIRYLLPVHVGVEARVTARRREQRNTVHDMEALLTQEGEVRVRARARFVQEGQVPWP
jgi:uncharacterized protein (TIGR00369 family)